jgi:hypothetical protein
MTITLGEDNIYLIVILILMGIQVYQQTRIHSIKKEIDQIWGQIGTVILATSSRITELEKELIKKKHTDEDIRDSEATS